MEERKDFSANVNITQMEKIVRSVCPCIMILLGKKPREILETLARVSFTNPTGGPKKAALHIQRSERADAATKIDCFASDRKHSRAKSAGYGEQPYEYLHYHFCGGAKHKEGAAKENEREENGIGLSFE